MVAFSPGVKTGVIHIFWRQSTQLGSAKGEMRNMITMIWKVVIIIMPTCLSVTDWSERTGLECIVDLNAFEHYEIDPSGNVFVMCIRV